jgi:ABC-type multidrug transport system fused ATPase/permease subunit
VTIGGRNVADYSLEAVLENIAVISQDVFLFDGSIAENIRVGRKDASIEAVRAASLAANADGFISALPQGYDAILGGNGARLSGGERQRISLARALLRDAPVLVMDEATAHIDPLTEALIQQAINRLAGRKTVIIVSHRLDSIAHCDRIILLNEGRVSASGSHEELLASSRHYRDMWALQQRNLAWTLTDERQASEGPEPGDVSKQPRERPVMETMR